MLILKTWGVIALTICLAYASPLNKKDTIKPRYEYIVVGSGAGGGTLASRLARAGKTVLLIEAGDDQGESVQEDIPAFFPAASEYDNMSWDFFVRHYHNATQEARNSKATYVTPTGETYIGLNPPPGSTLKGIWYPRAATLGGCTAHNAMITVYPHTSDWSNIQTITGDASWAPDKMRKYFVKLEQNQYLKRTDANSKGHGFDGWLGSSQMPTSLIAGDTSSKSYLSAGLTALGGTAASLKTEQDLKTAFKLELNADYPDRDTTTGFYQIPEAVNKGDRAGSRDIVLDTVAKGYPLTVQLNTFVTKIRFSKDKVPVALGVDFLTGSALYSADPRSGSSTGIPGSVNATVEVIIAAGTFNTPQILKLSGIGPAAELKQFGIPIIADLPGVGTNLKDHYEISSIVKSNIPFSLLENCTFLNAADPCYNQWAARGADRGPYATNLLEAAVLKKSPVATDTRDQLIFSGPVSFKGYYQGYTGDAVGDTRHWTWAGLKAHSANNAGTVKLTSKNPLIAPEIFFNYFEAGVTANNEVSNTLSNLVDIILFGRKAYASLPTPYANNFTEVYPGPAVTSRAQLEQFVKDEAWGHHATGTAKIGATSDKSAVLDSAFRVRGVSALRVVDASALPDTPGFFPVSSVYMIGEKASDVVLDDYLKVKLSKACFFR